MMHVLIDTTVPLNVYLNGIQKRPMSSESAQVMVAPLLGKMIAYMTPTAFGNTYYFLQKNLPLTRANALAADVLKVVRILPQLKSTFTAALQSGWNDVEDAAQYMAAKRTSEISHICTNNGGDFEVPPGSSITVVTPAALLTML
ncbi:MAG TPA: hypothetical protein PLV70_02640 [Flavobacteriales bacterium]|nr:hypothetical protein [Flavobacteriales bacterium]HRO38833.1 hypothetical protein [Flavobacteriales bacterium]HRP81655.1 hypothetical protein [Flavobacteriales bacterium]HRQ83993.1 hypothetical protein [Flavobacteriales bacterium]